MTTHSRIAVAAPSPIQAPDAIVTLTDLQRRFGKTAALDGISLTVRRGEILGIIGRSGAGKSTLIRCLNGLEAPDSGSIVIDGQRVDGQSEADLQRLRRRIGMIFQHFNLLSAKTVEANVALPLKIAGVGKSERLKRAREMLELVGLSDKARSYPRQLSGGQKQRVGIARALAARPAILLSDEATSALDPETTRSILALLNDINRSLGLSIVLITHEMDVVREIADRVAVIDAGRIVEHGDVAKVFAGPQTAISRSLLAGSRPELPGFILSRLHASLGNNLVLSVDVEGSYAQRQFFTDIAKALGNGANLLQGGIDYIQSTPVARFFLEVPRQDLVMIDELTGLLRARATRLEVLGYV